MPRKPLSPGDILEARCTRCRAILNHTIVALVEQRPARVKCNTCGGEHKYHPPKPEKTLGAAAPAPRKTAVPRSTRPDPRAVERQEWETQRMELSRREALPYAQDGRYKVRELISHPLFGLGIVQQLVGPNKMEVLFEAGKKILRCG